MAGLDIAKRSVRGSLILFVGSFSSALMSAIAIFLIARLLGPAQYGVYSLALVIPGLFVLFLDFGVDTAITRYSAYSISQDKPQEARRFTVNGIYFLWLMGGAFALLNYVLAGTLSVLLLHRTDLTPYVQLMSLSVLSNTILVTITAAAIGWNWMSLSSFSQALQGAIKLALSPLLILVGLGVAGALVGHIVSLLSAGLVGTAVLYLARLRGSREAGTFTSDVKEMLRFSLPIYAGALTTGLAGYFVTIILAAIASNAIFGLYQAAFNLLTPMNLVSSSLVLPLLPAFASIDGIGGDVKLAFRQAYKFVAFLVTPILVFMASASLPLVRVFYGGAFIGSAHYLQLLALAYLPVAFGYAVHAAFFNGFGRSRLTLLLYASSALVLVAFAPLLAIQLSLGVEGLIYATFVSLLVAWALGTFMAKRFMGTTLDLKASCAILLVSAVSFAVTIFLPTFAFSNALSLFVDLIVFFGIYTTLAPLAGAVTRDDMDVMDHTFRDLGFISSVFGLILRYERGVISLKERATS